MSPRRRSANRTRGGFTLIELMADVVVIGFLASLALANYNSTLRQARIVNAIGNIKAIQTDLQSIEAGGDTPPATLASSGAGRCWTPGAIPTSTTRFRRTGGFRPSAELGRSFGSASPEEKDAISHRGKALQAFIKSLT